MEALHEEAGQQLPTNERQADSALIQRLETVYKEDNDKRVIRPTREVSPNRFRVDPTLLRKGKGPSLVPDAGPSGRKVASPQQRGLKLFTRNGIFPGTRERKPSPAP